MSATFNRAIRNTELITKWQTNAFHHHLHNCPLSDLLTWLALFLFRRFSIKTTDLKKTKKTSYFSCVLNANFGHLFCQPLFRVQFCSYHSSTRPFLSCGGQAGGQMIEPNHFLRASAYFFLYNIKCH